MSKRKALNALRELQKAVHPAWKGFMDPAFHVQMEMPGRTQESKLHFARNWTGKNYPLFNEEDDFSGASPKIHYRIGDKAADGRILPSRNFMVKPYYEDLTDWPWVHGYPMAGWAEIAMQGIMHAAGMGEQSQRVHAYQPPSGPPVLVVELEPNVHRVGNVDLTWKDPDNNKPLWYGTNQHGYGRVVVPDRIRSTAMRLAALDFLTNNQDRHGGNLLFSFDHDKKNGTVLNDLLAIDHGRSFHYRKSLRFGDDSKDTEHLWDYFKQAPGYGIFKLDHNNGKQLGDLANWWKRVGKHVRREFHTHLAGLGALDLVPHMLKSFNARADALDSFAKNYHKLGARAFSVARPNKKAWSLLTVPVFGHAPTEDFVGAPGEDEEDFSGGGNGEVCPTCGECLSCNPHKPDLDKLSTGGRLKSEFGGPPRKR